VTSTITEDTPPPSSPKFDHSPLGIAVLWKIAAGSGVGLLVGQASGYVIFHYVEGSPIPETGDTLVALGITLLPRRPDREVNPRLRTASAAGSASLGHSRGLLVEEVELIPRAPLVG
jgi:hypothetical protein